MNKFVRLLEIDIDLGGNEDIRTRWYGRYSKKEKLAVLEGIINYLKEKQEVNDE